MTYKKQQTRTYPNTELGLSFSGTPSMTIDIGFGGFCEQCNEHLEATQEDSEFGRLACPRCEIIIGPTIRGYGTDDGGNADTASGWTNCSPHELSTANITLYQRRKGDCSCGGVLGENTVESPLGSPETACDTCGSTPALATQWNIIDNGKHDIEQQN